MKYVTWCKLPIYVAHLPFYLIVVGFLSLTIHLSTTYLMVKALSIKVHVHLLLYHNHTLFKLSLMTHIILHKMTIFFQHQLITKPKASNILIPTSCQSMLFHLTLPQKTNIPFRYAIIHPNSKIIHCINILLHT